MYRFPKSIQWSILRVFCLPLFLISTALIGCEPQTSTGNDSGDTATTQGDTQTAGDTAGDSFTGDPNPGPGDTGPGDSNSGDPFSGDPYSGDAGPGDAGPGDIGPGDIGPGDLDFGDSVSPGDAPDIPVPALSPQRLTFYSKIGGAQPPDRTLEITNDGTGSFTWTASSDQSWLSVTPTSGDTTSEIDTLFVSADPTGLAQETLTGTITITPDTGSPFTVAIIFRLCAGSCLFVDAGRAGRVIPATVFGDQIEYTNNGTWLWDAPWSESCSSAQNGGSARASLMNEFSQLGVGLLRYTGGTPSDFFRWRQAVAPLIQDRIPQISPFESNNGVDGLPNTADDVLKYECPVFGPVEFMGVADTLGAEMLITANAGTAVLDPEITTGITPAQSAAKEAADWLTDFETRGVTPRYWEVGNEVYINGADYPLAAVYMSALDYAALYDEFARELRTVNPNVRVGIATDEDEGRLQVILENVTEPIDFISSHGMYAPLVPVVGSGLSDLEMAQAVLGVTAFNKFKLQKMEEQLELYGQGISSAAEIAITEHAAWYLVSDVDNLYYNRTLASALYSALTYNMFVANPRVTIANHINLSSPFWQAAINTSMADGFSQPVRSAYYYVFKMYAEAAGGQYVPVEHLGIPTITTVPYGANIDLFEINGSPQPSLPTLDAIAVVPETGVGLQVYIVNRDLVNVIKTRITFDGIDLNDFTSLRIEVLNGATFDAENTFDQQDAVTLLVISAGVIQDFSGDIPAHSMIRYTFE